MSPFNTHGSVQPWWSKLCDPPPGARSYTFTWSLQSPYLSVLVNASQTLRPAIAGSASPVKYPSVNNVSVSCCVAPDGRTQKN
jgi:hypothetical protein